MTGDASGRLTLLTASVLGGTNSQQFQPIQVKGGSRALISVSWCGPKLELGVNGYTLAEDPDRAIAPLAIPADPVPQQGTFVSGIVPERASTDAEFPFLATLKDIDAKLFAQSRYELIRAAGLLRQCFVNERPLVAIVNRKHRCTFRFCVLDYHKNIPLVPDVHCRTLDPSRLPRATTKNASLADSSPPGCSELVLGRHPSKT